MVELNNLKYAELRKLAKAAGIKANQKHEVLLAALTKHYEEQKKTKEAKTPDQTKINQVKSVSNRVTASPKLAGSKGTSLPEVKKAVTPKATAFTVSVEKAKKNSKTPQSARSTTVQSKWEKKVFTPTLSKNNMPKSKTNTSTVNKNLGKRKSRDSVSTPEPQPKRRRSTFEKVPTPNLKTPEIEATTPQERRRSSRSGKTNSSPGVKDMLNAMKSDMNDQEMKDSLLSAIEKKVQGKAKTNEMTGTSNAASSIPRFAAFLKKRQESKPITPGNKDWNKIHQKNFDKFDSIDMYLEKKRKRAEEITSSAKKAKVNVQEMTAAMKKLKSHKVTTGVENKFKKPRLSNPSKTTPFKPSVFTAKNMNFNFTAKKISPKTLPRKSPKTVLGSVKKEAVSARKSTGALVQRKSTATPFKFTGGNTLNNTIASTKKMFNLKESLSKPLGYKPHKGKLKPYEKTGPASLTSATKTTKTRENLKTSVAQRRADKKKNSMMSRRGINM